MNIEYNLSKEELLQYSLEINKRNVFIGFLLSHGNIIGTIFIFIISIIMFINHKSFLGILFLIISVIIYFFFSFLSGIISGKSVIKNYLDPIFQNIDINIYLEFTKSNIYRNRDIIYKIKNIKCFETKSFILLDDNKNEKIIIPKKR